MVAFISRTQTDVKFYTGFLFEEKEAKVSIIAFSFVLNCCFDFMGDNYTPVWCKCIFCKHFVCMKMMSVLIPNISGPVFAGEPD